jgi:pyridoxine 4-dehydrogenase
MIQKDTASGVTPAAIPTCVVPALDPLTDSPVAGRTVVAGRPPSDGANPRAPLARRRGRGGLGARVESHGAWPPKCRAESRTAGAQSDRRGRRRKQLNEGVIGGTISLGLKMSGMLSPMATRTVPLGDLEIARIGLGTNRLTVDKVAFVKDAVAAGVQLIDTAHTYTRGQSEQTIGAALSPLPENVVLATKGGWNGAHPDVLRPEIEESLRRLRTDRIGLYYLHRVDPETPLEVSLEAIKEARDSGKILHVGVSNVGVEQIERARQVVPIVAVQNQYNVSQRKHDDVVDYCAREGIVFVAYFPLRGGGPPALAEVAERHGATRAQIALAWLLKRSPTLATIPGTLSIDHLRANLAAMEIEFSEGDFDALSAD